MDDFKKREKQKAEIRDSLKDFVLSVRVMKTVADAEIDGFGELMLDVLIEDLQKMKKPASGLFAPKKAMLSQPMAGKTDAEIAATRERAMAALEKQGYYVVNTLFTDEWYSKDAMERRGVVQIPLCFLAKSLENMSLCHAAYFCKGWENARGCKIEHDAAVAYGLEIIYEEDA